MDPKPKHRMKPENIKSKLIQARLTEKEYQDLSLVAKTSDRKISDVVRQAITRARPWTVENKKIQSEKIRHLAMVGNNLNQIARWCNTYKSAADTVEITRHLVALESEIKKALE